MENTPLLSPLFLGGHPLLDPLRRASSLKPLHQSAIASDPLLPPSPSLDLWPSSCPDPLNFQVDDLLDFSHTEEEDTDEQEASALTQEEQEQEAVPCSHAEGAVKTEKKSTEALVLPQVVACQPTTSGLCAPPDELADQLEWLSAFTEDSSYSGNSTLVSLTSSRCLSSHPDITSCTTKVQDTFQTSSPVSVLETSCSSYSNSSVIAPTVVRSRARSKRSRTGGRIWSLDTLMPTLVENRLGGAQENTVFIGSGCSREPELCHPAYEELHYKSSKKAKKPPSNTHKGLSQSDASPARRCSHCLVQKTPQWRAGPLGPKTLCNACGVRYKSGRLLPEYRPASSPTFVSEVHSNSHKRVLEMRRLKDLEAQTVVLKDEDTSTQEDHDDLYGVNMPEDEEAHSQSYPYRGHSIPEKQESFSAYDDDDDDEDDEDQESRLEIAKPIDLSMVMAEEPKEESINSSD